LQKIPLEKRLVFFLTEDEDEGRTLYHKSVVDAIKVSNPKQTYFTEYCKTEYEFKDEDEDE